MRRKRSSNQATRFLRSAAQAPRERYVLRLYVTGLTPRSTEAVANLLAVCEEHLPGRHQVEVIDLYEHPELAQREQIVAAPTVVKKLPPPARRLVGNLCDAERVLLALNLKRSEI